MEPLKTGIQHLWDHFLGKGQQHKLQKVLSPTTLDSTCWKTVTMSDVRFVWPESHQELVFDSSNSFRGPLSFMAQITTSSAFKSNGRATEKKTVCSGQIETGP